MESNFNISSKHVHWLKITKKLDSQKITPNHVSFPKNLRFGVSLKKLPRETLRFTIQLVPTTVCPGGTG